MKTNFNLLSLLVIIAFASLILSSCKPKTNAEFANQSDGEIDTLTNQEVVIDTSFYTPISRDSLNRFLEKPFNLYNFKKKVGGTNSGGGRNEDYFAQPRKEGMYYRYFLFYSGNGYLGKRTKMIIKKESGFEITVYKELGKYQYKYLDPTEELLEVRARFNIKGLPELALVGLLSNTIIKKFGNPDILKNECFIYQNKNKALVLKIESGIVKWLKYVNLKEGLDLRNNEAIYLD
jgi:hypothetical protein